MRPGFRSKLASVLKCVPARGGGARCGGEAALNRASSALLYGGVLAVLAAFGGDWGRIECAREETTREAVPNCDGRFVSTTKGVKYESGCFSSRTANVTRCVEARCREGFAYGSGRPKLGIWQAGPPRACLTKEEAERRING